MSYRKTLRTFNLEKYIKGDFNNFTDVQFTRHEEYLLTQPVKTVV